MPALNGTHSANIELFAAVNGKRLIKLEVLRQAQSRLGLVRRCQSSASACRRVTSPVVIVTHRLFTCAPDGRPATVARHSVVPRVARSTDKRPNLQALRSRSLGTLHRLTFGAPAFIYFIFFCSMVKLTFFFVVIIILFENKLSKRTFC